MFLTTAQEGNDMIMRKASYINRQFDYLFAFLREEPLSLLE